MFGRVHTARTARFRAAGILVGLLCLVLPVEGETPFPEVTPSPSPGPALSASKAQQDLMELRSNGQSRAAIDLAKRILFSFPVDEAGVANSTRPLRSAALETLKENDALSGYIAELEDRSRANPEDLQTNLVLAEAFSLIDPETATLYYEKAGKIAPENIGLTLKLASGLAGSGHDEHAMQLYDELLAEHLERTLSAAQGELFLLYSRQNALNRLAKQIVLGFNAPITDPPRSGPTLYRASELAERFVKLGDEEDAIAVLQAARPSPDQPRNSEIRTQISLELKLIDLLIKYNRTAEAIQTIIHQFSPRPLEPSPRGSGPRWEFATELITWEPDSSGVPTCPAISLLRKSEAINGLQQLVASIEADLEKHPDDINEQTIYAVVAVWGRVEKARPFLSRYFERISGLPPKTEFHFTSPGLGTQPEKPPFVSHELLMAMAQQLRRWPAARALVFPALAAAQAEFGRNGTEPNRFMGLWPEIARVAFTMNDLPKAQEILRKILKIVEEDARHSRWKSTEELLAFFEMMLRARMKEEAAAILQIMRNPTRSDAAFSGTREAALLRRAARVALDAGANDLANSAASSLPAMVEAGLNDEERTPDDLISSVQILLRLHRTADAKALIDRVRQAKQGDKTFARPLEQAERMARLLAGQERDLTPALFLASTPRAQAKSAIHWDLAASAAPWYGIQRFVSAIEGAPATLQHPYRVKILAGETENQLHRVAEVRTREPRGVVRASLPPNAHLGRVLLSDDQGNETIGPAFMINATPNLIVNSAFEGLPSRTDLDQSARELPGWTRLPEGDWSVAADGPLRRSIRFRSARSGQVLITGQRIPVEPTDEFFQSAWIERMPRETRLRVGRRYLNRDGVELRISFCPEPDDTGPWLLLQQKLEVESPTHEQRIPGGCAFIEPVIEVSASDSHPALVGEMATWSDMYLGKLQKPPAENPARPNETVLFSGKERPTQITVSPDSHFIALGYPSGMVRVLDRQGKQIAERPIGSHAIVSLRFTRDSAALIVFAANGEILRLTLQPAVTPTVLMPPGGEIRKADIAPDGATAVVFRIGKSDTSPGEQGRFEILDLANRKVIRVIDVQWSGVFNLIMSDDGSRFYAVGNERMYPQRLWLIPSGEEIPFTAEQLQRGFDLIGLLGLQQPRDLDVYVWADNSPRAICADPKRHRSALVRDKEISIYDLLARRNIWVFPNAREVQRLAIVPDDGAVLGIGEDGAVRQWKMPSGATQEPPAP